MVKFIKSHLFSFIVLIIMFFSMGFFVTEFVYNNFNAYYAYSFETVEDVNYLISEEFFVQSMSILDEKEIAYADIDYVDMLDKSKLNVYEDYYELLVRKSFFPDILRVSNGTVNQSFDRCSKYLNLIFSNASVNNIDIKLVGYCNPFIIGGIFTIIAIVGFAVLGVFAYKKNKAYVDISDNDRIFNHPFHKKYWKSTKSFFKNVKSVCTISILFAFMMICKLIPIPSGFGSLGLGFTYLIFSVITLIYGPLCGIVIGAMSDILGFFLFNGTGIFFFGYTLDAMLAGFTYGICFYKTKITFTKCLTARIFVNLFINVFLGSIWWSIIYDLNFDQMITYMTITSIPKNIIYLIPQSVLLFLVIKALVKPISRFGLIEVEIADNISLI